MIHTPILIVQGQNDPRVPITEAEQMVAAVKKNGVPVWYVVGTNEGHGFAKKANQDYLAGRRGDVPAPLSARRRRMTKSRSVGDRDFNAKDSDAGS